MKLYGYQPIWSMTGADTDALTQADAAQQALRHMYPYPSEPVQLFLGRGLAARGDDDCPLLVLRARILMDGDSPRIVPAEDCYHLCAQTLEQAFGVDRDTLFNMRAMLDETPSPAAFPAMLEIWGRLLQGYCSVQPGQAVVLAAHETYPVPADAALPRPAGVCSTAGWAQLAAEHAADGSRVLLTGRSQARLHDLRAALPDGLPALCSWDDTARIQSFASQILDDIDQADALDAQADRAGQEVQVLHEQLQTVRQTVEAFRADWQPGCTAAQARNDRLLPDEIAAGVPFPLDDAQLALLRTLPGEEQPEPDDAVELLCARWAECSACYDASPVCVGGQPVMLPVGMLTLGAGSVLLDAESVELLLQLNRMRDALEQDPWLYDALICRNDAQLSLYYTLADALTAAAQCLDSDDLQSHRVQYRGAPGQRAKALQALRELESRCAAWEREEPYMFSDLVLWQTVRTAAKAHCTLVDGVPPRTQDACRIARAALEMQLRLRDVQAAWRPLCGDFHRPAKDCGPLSLLLRLCLACNEHGLHLRADELPLPQETAACIAQAGELAQQQAALCQTLSEQGAQPAVLDAVRALDLNAYRKECTRAAQDARRQALRTRAAVVEIVRRHAPLWAARLETEACPEDDMRAVWEEKSARAGRSGGIGRLLARERELTQSCRSAQERMWSLRTRAAAAKRAAADPLMLALLTRAARGAADAADCAACAPVYLTASGQARGFDLVIADRIGMEDDQLAWQAARAAQALYVDLRPSRVPETRLVSADGAMGYHRAAEALVDGRASEQMYRVWWTAQGGAASAGELLPLVQQELANSRMTAVVSPAPADTRSLLADKLPADVLCQGTLYCGDPAILSAQRFDSVILCPGLSCEQLSAAARASLDAGAVWVLGAEQYGADWGRSLLLHAWQDGAPAADRTEPSDTVARVLAEMYGWETAIRPGGLELHTPAGPVWLALLMQDSAYPLRSDARAALYETGWTLDGLSLPEYQANPRQALHRLAAYGEPMIRAAG